MRHFLSILVLSLAMPVVALAQSSDACIDYWAVGPSGCDGTRPVAPPPMLPTPQAKPMTMPTPKPADPVEQFYQTYDKPPRAFVEFQVNPTPANAMAWVQEYQSIINKSSQTAEVWREAEAAFNQYQQTGSLPEEFTQALTDEERQQVLSIVKTGGVKPYNFSENSPASTLPSAFQNAVRGIPNKPAPAAAASKVDALAALNRGSRTTSDTPEPNRLSMAALNKGEDTSTSDVIKVNYYFSAVCPFCRRFEPEFAKVQQQFNTKRLDVTCVDMTPGERVPANKTGVVDCKWRPLGPGEKAANQVRATPSLLIDFGPTKSLELVEGFVESDQLLSYLNKKVSE